MRPQLSLAALAAVTSMCNAETVRFSVAVPESTPLDASVWISGSVSALGGWRPDGLALGKEGERWVAVVELPDGPFEWKVTLGSWERCEANADGSERANRESVAAKGAVIEATVARWRDGPIQRTSSATGDIRTFAAPASAEGIEPRTLMIRLPKGYDHPNMAGMRYSVLYCLDGQNVFDSATSFAGVEWQVDETHDALVAEKRIAASIIVAIPNSPKRMDELTFVRDESRKAGGTGTAFLTWLSDRVKPTIDREFRTRPDRASTTILGSSLGGLFALEAVSRRGEVFGRAIAMSPSLWWADEELLRRWSAPGAALPDPLALWVDMGTAEERNVPNGHVERMRRLTALFNGRPNVQSTIEDGGKHHESSWAKRLPEAFQFALPRAEAAPAPVQGSLQPTPTVR